MANDDDETEFSGILGGYPGSQPGGILAGLFPAQDGYDPQQPAGPALLPGAVATPLAAAALPPNLPHILRMIGHNAAMLAAAGGGPDPRGATNPDDASQGAGQMPSDPVAAPDASSAGAGRSGDVIAQLSPLAPGITSAAPSRGPVPPPASRPLPWPGRFAYPSTSSIPENPSWLPGTTAPATATDVVKERWPRPDDRDPSALLRGIAAVPATPGPSLPALLRNFIDPADLLQGIIRAENAPGDPNARSGSSSATGLTQFVNDTWEEMIRKYRPDLYARWASDEKGLLALRTDPDLSRQMALAYANENARALERAHLPVTKRNIYLSHFLGPGDALKILKADPDASADTVVPKAAADKNNGITRTMTVRDLIQRIEDRMEHGPGWQWPSQ